MELTEEKQKELENLKKTHKKVYTLTVPLDEDDETKVAVYFLRKPDNLTRGMVRALTDRDKVYQAIEAAIKTLRIGGDDLSLISGNDDAVAACESQIAMLMSTMHATLKKN